MRRIFFALLLLPAWVLGQDSLNVRRVAELHHTNSPLIWNLEVTDTLLLTPFGDSGLYLDNVSSPAEPQELSLFDVPGSSWDVAINGNFAFISSQGPGLRIGNVSDPASPIEVGSLPMIAGRVSVFGDYCYVGGTSMLIVDISDPTSPFLAGLFSPLGYSVTDVVVVGNLGYFVLSGVGLLVADMSDPVSPVELGIVETPGSPKKVAVRDQHAFIADYDGGLCVVNVVNPTTPEIVASYSIGSNVVGVAVMDDFACITGEFSGLHILNISDPTNPIEVGFHHISVRNYYDVEVLEHYACVGELFRVTLYDCSEAMGTSREPSFAPKDFALMTVYPNPFNARTTIEFELPRQSSVEMNVFDVQGRLARGLLNRVFTAGSHSYLFDAQGLPSGSYFVKMNAGEFQEVKKMVLVK